MLSCSPAVTLNTSKYSKGAGSRFISNYFFSTKSRAGLAAIAHMVFSLTAVGEVAAPSASHSGWWSYYWLYWCLSDCSRVSLVEWCVTKILWSNPPSHVLTEISLRLRSGKSFLLQDIFSRVGFVPPFKNKQAQHGGEVVLLFGGLLPTSHSSLPGFLCMLERVQFSLVLCHLPKVQERGLLGAERKAILYLIWSWRYACVPLRKWLLEKRRQIWPRSQEGILVPPDHHSAEDREAWVWEVFPGGEKFCSEARSAGGWLCKYLTTGFRS